ncbi:hypothetical protein ACFP81_12565 [Deinococcus lacus]|uniref:Fervidolysin-like N-terminal prodomain domain-containing protein n=1 Tax=Deinococcus lacus TaxID=392561 RepID=A0ABW1YIQ2_9DEIO
MKKIQWTALSLSLLLASCGVPQQQVPTPAKGPATQQGDFRPGQLVVGLKAGVSAEQVAAKLGAQVLDTQSRLNAALLQLPADTNLAKAARAAEFSGLVRYASPNFIAAKPKVQPGSSLMAQALDSDPEYGLQWFHRNMRNPEAWKTATGKGIRIGVADEDIDRHHPDLAANVVYPGYDAPNDTLITAATPMTDTASTAPG